MSSATASASAALLLPELCEFGAIAIGTFSPSPLEFALPFTRDVADVGFGWWCVARCGVSGEGVDRCGVCACECDNAGEAEWCRPVKENEKGTACAYGVKTAGADDGEGVNPAYALPLPFKFRTGDAVVAACPCTY